MPPSAGRCRACTSPSPDPRAIDGRYCRIEPIVPAHARQLHEAYHAGGGTVNWDYLSYGPFETLDDFEVLLEGTCLGSDPLF